jgi:hypothetical protein
MTIRPPAVHDPERNEKLATAMLKAKEGGMTKVAIEGILARVSSLRPSFIPPRVSKKRIG